MDTNLVMLDLALLGLFVALGALRLRALNKKKRLKGRSIEDLTREERLEEYPIEHLDVDINRFARWKVRFLNGTNSTRVGDLSVVPRDHPRTFSQVVAYREIA